MKVKLLKKIRKRFIIEKIESLSSDPNEYDKSAGERFEFPFYKLYDIHQTSSWYSFYSQSFEEAYDYLVETIKDRYKEKFRHKPGKKSVAWWPIKK